MANTVGLTLILIIALAVSRATALQVTNQFHVTQVLKLTFLFSVTSVTAPLMVQKLVTMMRPTGEKFSVSENNVSS